MSLALKKEYEIHLNISNIFPVELFDYLDHITSDTHYQWQKCEKLFSLPLIVF